MPARLICGVRVAWLLRGVNTKMHHIWLFPMIFKPKKDRKAKARGKSKFLELSCSNCGAHVMTYQKDGPGALIRLYLDRIRASQNLTCLKEIENKTSLPALKCSKCSNLIGTPMIYACEKRLAYRLVRGSFKKQLAG